MQVDADVYAVFLAPLDCMVDVGQHLLIHLVIFSWLAPVPIGEGQAHEIESPVAYPLEFFLIERFGVSCCEVVQQIEPSPFAVSQFVLCLQGETAQHAHC